MSDGDAEDLPESGLAIDARVRVHPDTEEESRGIIVDDFGDAAGISVDIGGQEIAKAARRWAVLLDSGSLLFVNSDSLRLESAGD
jgi:hypothetical protein